MIQKRLQRLTSLRLQIQNAYIKAIQLSDHFVYIGSF